MKFLAFILAALGTAMLLFGQGYEPMDAVLFLIAAIVVYEISKA